jgi:hypothetical protein
MRRQMSNESLKITSIRRKAVIGWDARYNAAGSSGNSHGHVAGKLG